MTALAAALLFLAMLAPPLMAANGAPREFGVRRGFTVVDTIASLRKVMAQSDQKIRVKPGVYLVSDALDGDPKTVFRCSGSNNHFDLRGVTIQIDTKVMASMKSNRAHDLGVYRIEGSNVTFEGARFEDVGDHPPRRSLGEFSVTGDDVKFLNCRFIIRGSAPYGYGDIYGKGAGAAVWLQKHSAVGITGDRCVIDSCDFRIHTFGHGIHMHGAQDTVIRNVTMEGDLRPTDDIYKETSGPAVKYGFKVMFPPWRKGQPIPKGQMLSLTEDGIRAYVYGNDRNGKRRRTGHITVENCAITRMRGGITICMARTGRITNCTVIDSGGHAYSVPSDGIVRNCRGNAAYAPLLSIPYKQTRRADIELELLESEKELGDHPLARITGDRGHRIKITYAGKALPKKLRPIVLGSVGDRYTEANCTPAELVKHHQARKIVLENMTAHPVELTQYSWGCQVTSLGPVDDNGEDSQVRAIRH